MDKVKEFLKQMNKKHLIIIFVVVFIVCCFIYNVMDLGGYTSYSSAQNSEKVNTSSMAISYAKQYVNYGKLTEEIKDSSKLHSIKKLEITDTSIKEKNDSYRVIIKGNGSGYSDDYDTKSREFTFDVKLEVNKQTGDVKVLSVTTHR